MDAASVHQQLAVRRGPERNNVCEGRLPGETKERSSAMEDRVLIGRAKKSVSYNDLISERVRT